MVSARAQRRWGAGLLLVLALLFGWRLHKNYLDLQQYFADYYRQMPTKFMEPYLEKNQESVPGGQGLAAEKAAPPGGGAAPEI